MEANVLVATALAATAVLFAAVWVRRPDARRLALRGAAIALLVAAILGLIVVAVAVFVTRATVDQALLAGVVIAAGYLWLNLTILGIGLWFRPTTSWALGSALATPVILAALGFGYAAYRAWPLQ